MKKQLRKDPTLPEKNKTLESISLKKILSKSDIKTAVARLAGRISRDYDGKIPVAVCVLLGARPFFEDLVDAMTVEVEKRFLRISSYGENTRPGHLNLIEDIESEVKDRDVIIVEDIVDTSRTVEFVLEHIESKNPSSVRICALIDKKGEHTKGSVPHYSGFRVNGGFIVGYGMDYKGAGRDLENIYMCFKTRL